MLESEEDSSEFHLWREAGGAGCWDEVELEIEG